MSETIWIAHHGVKGQKWYIRRYQNEDGSLTPLGKRRLKKLEGRQAKIDSERNKITGGKEQPKKSPNPHGKKSIFDMDDEELRDEINRLNLEKQYKQFMKELYPSKKKERLIDGRRIVSDILTTSFTTVGKSVGTNLLGKGVNKLGKHLGLEEPLYIAQSGKKEEKKDKK